jgi:hypothetical protein
MKSRYVIYFIIVIMSAMYRLYDNDIEGFILSILVLSLFCFLGGGHGNKGR